MFWKTYILNHISKKGYHSYTGTEFSYWVKKAGKGNKEDRRLRTLMPKRRSRVFQAERIDETLEWCLDSGKYTEKRMLLVRDPFQTAPLTAVLLFVTEVPCSVKVTLDSGEVFQEETEITKRHRVAIYGLHPAQQNEVHVELRQGDAVIYKKDILVQTGELPKELCDSVIVKKQSETQSPLTLVFGGDTKYAYAFDSEGEVRYYLKQRTRSYGLYPLSQGHFLFLSKKVLAPSYGNPHSILAAEMDFLGRVYREYIVPEGIHHDGCEMTPGGNLLTVSSSMNMYVEDAVIEIDRETGKVVKKLCLFDVLSDHPYLDYFDWAHINTVSYQAEEHSILISARNLHSVLKIDWKTNELLWIFCDTEFWKGTKYENKVLSPKGDTPFCYQSHAAYFLDGYHSGDVKRLIIYDNHWQKRRPVASFDKDKKSYVRIYEIDEKKKTVEHLKSYGTEKSTIRSNGVVVGNSVFSMSGALRKTVENCGGKITEFDSMTGREKNVYLTKTTFYRGYSFFADFHALCEPMEKRDEGLLGVKPEALYCPEETLKKVKWKPCCCERFFPIQDEKRRELARIHMDLYENTLLVNGKEHQVQKIFFRGKKHIYEKDYSETFQRLPHLFGEFCYSLAVSTDNLKKDAYWIYIQCGNQIYRTTNRIRVVE